SSTLKLTTPDQANNTVLGSFAGEDGYAFCEALRGLAVETTPEFQRISAQFFAALANHFVQLRHFACECLIAGSPLQARPKKIDIVLVCQQFAKDLWVMSLLFENRSVQWLQNS